VHAIGKGILRFHAVYWPAILLSAGLPLPTEIFVHGYLTIRGRKMSKSLGNVADPADLVRRYGAEAVRYWLLRAVPPTGDADYTDEKLEARYTADLADDLGNLLNRTVSMLHRYRAGVIPASRDPADDDAELRALAENLAARLDRAIDRDFDPQAALEAIWDLVLRGNRYVEETAPWALARYERSGDTRAARRLDTVLSTLAEALRLIAESLRPFLPTAAGRIAAQLNIPLADPWPDSLIWGRLAPGTIAAKPEPIFPKERQSTSRSEPTE
jgi:methionyl-tRNA synthetase